MSLMSPRISEQESTCRMLWKLAREHGWSGSIPLQDLIDDAAFNDDQRAKDIFERRVATKSYVLYQPSTGDVRLDVPHDQLAYDLRDNCSGYSELRIESTLSHFDGFD